MIMVFNKQVTQISSGFGHECVLMGDGVVRCWGENDWGQASSHEM